MQIEVDFDVWKTLTALRSSESVSYNDVLRKLLKLGPAGGAGSGAAPSDTEEQGYDAVGRFLPHGTKLQARYKGRLYVGEISRGRIITEGKTFRSLSAAAKGITATNINGLRFWCAKRPGESDWTLVTGLKRDGP